MPALDELRQDCLYGARILLKSPGFTAVAVLSLALGIGANTAIFTLIDSVLLRMLPVREPQQLVALTDPTAGGVSIGTSSGERGNLSTREFEALRDRTGSFWVCWRRKVNWKGGMRASMGNPQKRSGRGWSAEITSRFSELPRRWGAPSPPPTNMARAARPSP